MSITLNGSQIQSIPVVINANATGLINAGQNVAQTSGGNPAQGSIVISEDQTAGGQLSEAQVNLQSFWRDQLADIQKLTPNDFKTQDLPLARIKKIMKMDDEVKMISAEAPLLFAKAAQVFINELSLRAWIHTEESKRRTLQRNDIATAITKFDQFDFLIDIVPREELKPTRKPPTSSGGGNENLQYFYTVPQSGGGANTLAAIPQNQIVLAQPTAQGQTMQPVTVEGGQNQLLQIIQNSQQQNVQQVVSGETNQQIGSKQQQQAQPTVINTISEMQQQSGNQENIIQLEANNGQLQFPIRIQVQQNDGQNQVMNLENMQASSSSSTM